MWDKFQRFMSRGAGFGASMAMTLTILIVFFFAFVIGSVIYANWDTESVLFVLETVVKLILLGIASGIALFIITIPTHWLFLKIDRWVDRRRQAKQDAENALWEADWAARHPQPPV